MYTILLGMIFSYLIGSIPTSFLLTRALKGVDIRRYGSGNVGATNTLRVLGKGPALFVLICDILKGVISVTLLSRFFYNTTTPIDYLSFTILLGFMAIIGHIWPIFLKFKGGKGVATSIGVLLVLAPRIIIVAGVIWFVIVFTTRYVSLGSILGAVSLPITAAYIGLPLKFVMFTITLCVINTYKHRENIVRLINNEEPKIGERIRVK